MRTVVYFLADASLSFDHSIIVYTISLVLKCSFEFFLVRAHFILSTLSSTSILYYKRTPEFRMLLNVQGAH